MVAPARFGFGAPRAAPPPGTTGACEADRVLPAGGALAELLLHDTFTPFQRIYRVIPDDGIYEATRSRPVQFVLGSFTVPQQMALAVAEYRFRPYRFDGVIAGDAVPLEDFRGSLEIGNFISSSIVTQSTNLDAQQIPGAPQPGTPYQGIVSGGTVFGGQPTQGQSTPVPTTLQTIYGPGAVLINNPNRPALTQPLNNPSQYVITAQGAGLMPQSPNPQQGPQKLPFTYYVNEAQPVTLFITVFAPVKIPIAFFEGVLAGFLMPKNALQLLLDGVKPCQGA